MEPETGQVGYTREKEWVGGGKETREGELAERGRVPPAVTAARLMSEWTKDGLTGVFVIRDEWSSSSSSSLSCKL